MRVGSTGYLNLSSLGFQQRNDSVVIVLTLLAVEWHCYLRLGAMRGANYVLLFGGVGHGDESNRHG